MQLVASPHRVNLYHGTTMNVSSLSPVMQKLATQVRLAAETDASVFIVG